MGQGAPEVDAMREGIDVVEHRGPRSGESGHGLEECTAHATFRAAQQERQHAHHGEQDPCGAHYQEALAPPHAVLKSSSCKL